jgi:hypothetical protein
MMQATPEQEDAAAGAQAFGALATRLTDALGRCRAALATHTAVLPDGTRAAIDAQLAEFARRRVRIALYGEVKAGKSTLLNAIAGAVLSPAAFEPLTSVPVRVTYGEDTVWRLGERRLPSVAELEQVMREDAAGTNGAGLGEVVVETNLDLLELGGQVDLLDTPGVGSAAQFDAISAEVVRSLDAVVLVVRYPGLFTQFTRQLMRPLQADIGKLFVVWNLDAACAELSADERARHASDLRAHVVGAHDLFLVDARAGLRAMQSEDGAATVASGLTALIAALRRFASSGGRDVVALREAAKRAHQWLSEAQRLLTERQIILERALAETRSRLRAVDAAADSESADARRQCTRVEAAADAIGRRNAETAAKLATDVRRQLHRARRRWIRRGEFAPLHSAVTGATVRYADAVHAANQLTIESLQAEAGRVEAALTLAPRARTEPGVGVLAPEDRIKAASAGKAQLVRRATWHRWYLPGVAALERTALATDLRAQANWLEAVLRAAHDTAGAALAAKLAAIRQRADGEAEQIKTETNFAAHEAELRQLGADLPVIATQSAAVAQVCDRARALI